MDSCFSIVDVVGLRYAKERILNVRRLFAILDFLVFFFLLTVSMLLVGFFGLFRVVSLVSLSLQGLFIYAPSFYRNFYSDPRVDSLRYGYEPNDDQKLGMTMIYFLLGLTILIPPAFGMASDRFIYAFLSLLLLLVFARGMWSPIASKIFCSYDHYRLNMLSEEIPSLYIPTLVPLVIIDPILGTLMLSVLITHLVILAVSGFRLRVIVDSVWMEFITRTQAEKGFVDYSDILSFVGAEELSLYDLWELERYFGEPLSSIFTMALDVDLEFEVSVDGDIYRLTTTRSGKLRDYIKPGVAKELRVLRLIVKIPDKYIRCGN